VRQVTCKQLLSTGANWRLGEGACPGESPPARRPCANADCLPYLGGGEWGKVREVEGGEEGGGDG